MRIAEPEKEVRLYERSFTQLDEGFPTQATALVQEAEPEPELTTAEQSSTTKSSTDQSSSLSGAFGQQTSLRSSSLSGSYGPKTGLHTSTQSGASSPHTGVPTSDLSGEFGQQASLPTYPLSGASGQQSSLPSSTLSGASGLHTSDPSSTLSGAFGQQTSLQTDISLDERSETFKGSSQVEKSDHTLFKSETFPGVSVHVDQPLLVQQQQHESSPDPSRDDEEV